MNEKQTMTVGFIRIEADENAEGRINLTMISEGKGRLTKAKLNVMPLPLKLSLKEGTRLAFTIEK
tara:strand:+ start:325 stop:519 length:195 start_codon:yes stop_codon:yes gene_type:complete